MENCKQKLTLGDFMNRLQKETIAHEMRENGDTYRKIGEHFGVSVQRARQMVISFQRRESKIETSNPLLAEIACAECETVRIENCLLSSGIGFDIDEIVKGGVNRLLKVKNLGRKSVVKIAAALERMGKIDDAKKWMTTVII